MLKIIKTREGVKTPEKAHKEDSGIDFFLPGDVNILPGDNILIPLGIRIQLQEGYDMTFINKSGITSRTGVIVGACLIDNGYTGELKLNLINTSKFEASFIGGQKIIQGVIRKVNDMEIEEVRDFTNKKEEGRKEGGFGSSGLFSHLNKG